MLLSMLLACAVASAGQYQYPSSQTALPPSGGPAPVYYTPAPTAVAVAPDRPDLRAPVVGPMPGPRRCMPLQPGGAAPAPPGGHAVRRAPEAGHDLLRGRRRARRGSPGVEPGTRVAHETEAVPPPPAPQSTLPPPAPTSTLPPPASLTPEQKLSEIRRLLLGP